MTPGEHTETEWVVKSQSLPENRIKWAVGLAMAGHWKAALEVVLALSHLVFDNIFAFSWPVPAYLDFTAI